MFLPLQKFLLHNRLCALVPLRLIAGWRLLAGSWDYAWGIKPISEVAAYFGSMHLPMPFVSASVSVYAQALCGLLFIAGFRVRLAAFLMLVNFTVAILAAHLKDGIEQSFAAWMLWSVSILFLFFGAGALSVDALIAKASERTK